LLRLRSQQLSTLTRDLRPSDAASASGPSYLELRRYVGDLDLSALGPSSAQLSAIEGDPESFLLEGEVGGVSSELADVGRLNVSEAGKGTRGPRLLAPSCAC
jgi:hypothetical protein